MKHSPGAEGGVALEDGLNAGQGVIPFVLGVVSTYYQYELEISIILKKPPKYEQMANKINSY